MNAQIDGNEIVIKIDRLFEGMELEAQAKTMKGSELMKHLQVEPAKLHDSPTNPRGPYSKSWDLADLTSQGAEVLATLPVKARPHPKKKDQLQLVYGHRRKYAAISVGVQTIRVEVVELDDAGVLREQWAENANRRDVHPLLEAKHIELMVGKGATVEEISATSGNSEGWVRKRLSLTKLSSKCQKAFLANKITAAVAMILARIPVESLQNRALKEIGSEPTPTSARRWTRINCTLDLSNAPFDTKAGDLVDGAGSCSACPKRTGNQAALFDDLKSGNLCTDPPCHKKKRDAAWKLIKAKAKEEDQASLEGKAAEPHVDWQGQEAAYNSKFVSLGQERWIEGKYKTVRAQLKGKDIPPITLIRTKIGNVLKCVLRADVEKVLNKGKKGKAAASHTATPTKKAEREKRKLDGAVANAVQAEVVKRVVRRQPGKAFWGLMARTLVNTAWSESVKEVVVRRGIECKPSEAEGKLLKQIPKLSANVLRGLVLELAVSGRSYDSRGIADACKTLGVDAKKIRARVTKEAKAKAQAAAKKKAKPKVKKKAKKKAKKARKNRGKK